MAHCNVQDQRTRGLCIPCTNWPAEAAAAAENDQMAGRVRPSHVSKPSMLGIRSRTPVARMTFLLRHCRGQRWVAATFARHGARQIEQMMSCATRLPFAGPLPASKPRRAQARQHFGRSRVPHVAPHTNKLAFRPSSVCTTKLSVSVMRSPVLSTAGAQAVPWWAWLVRFADGSSPAALGTA